MAHLYPFGATSLSTPTEDAVYNALSKLSDKCYVFYDNRWSWRGQDIQTDFSIAKKDSYIQILEVKGGLWGRSRGKLLCNGQIPHQYRISQVNKQKKTLIEKLRNDGRDNGFVPISHAIAYPGIR